MTPTEFREWLDNLENFFIYPEKCPGTLAGNIAKAVRLLRAADVLLESDVVMHQGEMQERWEAALQEEKP